nr:polyprotein [Rana tamanavirus]
MIVKKKKMMGPRTAAQVATGLMKRLTSIMMKLVGILPFVKSPLKTAVVRKFITAVSATGASWRRHTSQLRSRANTRKNRNPMIRGRNSLNDSLAPQLAIIFGMLLWNCVQGQTCSRVDFTNCPVVHCCNQDDPICFKDGTEMNCTGLMCNFQQEGDQQVKVIEEDFGDCDSNANFKEYEISIFRNGLVLEDDIAWSTVPMKMRVYKPHLLMTRRRRDVSPGLVTSGVEGSHVQNYLTGAIHKAEALAMRPFYGSMVMALMLWLIKTPAKWIILAIFGFQMYMTMAFACEGLTLDNVMSTGTLSQINLVLRAGECHVVMIPNKIDLKITLVEREFDDAIIQHKTFWTNVEVNSLSTDRCPGDGDTKCPAPINDRTVCKRGYSDRGWTTGCFIFGKGGVCTCAKATKVSSPVQVMKVDPRKIKYKVAVHFGDSAPVYLALSGINPEGTAIHPQFSGSTVKITIFPSEGRMNDQYLVMIPGGITRRIDRSVMDTIGLPWTSYETQSTTLAPTTTLNDMGSVVTFEHQRLKTIDVVAHPNLQSWVTTFLHGNGQQVNVSKHDSFNNEAGSRLAGDYGYSERNGIVQSLIYIGGVQIQTTNALPCIEVTAKDTIEGGEDPIKYLGGLRIMVMVDLNVEPSPCLMVVEGKRMNDEDFVQGYCRQIEAGKTRASGLHRMTLECPPGESMIKIGNWKRTIKLQGSRTTSWLYMVTAPVRHIASEAIEMSNGPSPLSTIFRAIGQTVSSAVSSVFGISSSIPLAALGAGLIFCGNTIGKSTGNMLVWGGLATLAAALIPVVTADKYGVMIDTEEWDMTIGKIDHIRWESKVTIALPKAWGEIPLLDNQCPVYKGSINVIHVDNRHNTDHVKIAEALAAEGYLVALNQASLRVNHDNNTMNDTDVMKLHRQAEQRNVVFLETGLGHTTCAACDHCWATLTGPVRNELGIKKWTLTKQAIDYREAKNKFCDPQLGFEETFAEGKRVERANGWTHVKRVNGIKGPIYVPHLMKQKVDQTCSNKRKGWANMTTTLCNLVKGDTERGHMLAHSMGGPQNGLNCQPQRHEDNQGDSTLEEEARQVAIAGGSEVQLERRLIQFNKTGVWYYTYEGETNVETTQFCGYQIGNSHPTITRIDKGDNDKVDKILAQDPVRLLIIFGYDTDRLKEKMSTRRKLCQVIDEQECIIFPYSYKWSNGGYSWGGSRTVHPTQCHKTGPVEDELYERMPVCGKGDLHGECRPHNSAQMNNMVFWVYVLTMIKGGMCSYLTPVASLLARANPASAAYITAVLLIMLLVFRKGGSGGVKAGVCAIVALGYLCGTGSLMAVINMTAANGKIYNTRDLLLATGSLATTMLTFLQKRTYEPILLILEHTIGVKPEGEWIMLLVLAYISCRKNQQLEMMTALVAACWKFGVQHAGLVGAVIMLIHIIMDPKMRNRIALVTGLSEGRNSIGMIHAVGIIGLVISSQVERNFQIAIMTLLAFILYLMGTPDIEVIHLGSVQPMRRVHRASTLKIHDIRYGSEGIEVTLDDKHTMDSEWIYSWQFKLGLLAVCVALYDWRAGLVSCFMVVPLAKALTNNAIDDYLNFKFGSEGMEEFSGLLEDGLVSLKKKTWIEDKHIGYGYIYKTVLHTQLHVTGGQDLVIGGKLLKPSESSTSGDWITYGGPYSFEEPEKGKKFLITIKRKSETTSCEGEVNSTGSALLYGVWTPRLVPGESGTPIFQETTEGRQVPVGMAGHFVGVDHTENLELQVGEVPGQRARLDDDTKNLIRRGGRFKEIVAGCGSGKTRNVLVKAVETSLQCGRRIICAAPTRVVAREIWNVLRENNRVGIRIQSLNTRGSAEALIVTHQTLWNMIYSNDRIYRNSHTILIDESHMINPYTMSVQEMIKTDIEDGADRALILMTATGRTRVDQETNFLVEDKKINMGEVPRKALESKNQKVMVFCHSLKQCLELDNKIKELDPEVNTKILSRATFSMNYQQVMEMVEGIILTTNISEVGANFRPGVVIDVGLTMVSVETRKDDVRLITRPSTLASKIQRRGRCGRNKEGTYMFVNEPSDDTIYPIDDIVHQEAEILTTMAGRVYNNRGDGMPVVVKTTIPHVKAEAMLRWMEGNDKVTVYTAYKGIKDDGNFVNWDPRNPHNVVTVNCCNKCRGKNLPFNDDRSHDVIVAKVRGDPEPLSRTAENFNRTQHLQGRNSAYCSLSESIIGTCLAGGILSPFLSPVIEIYVNWWSGLNGPLKNFLRIDNIITYFVVTIILWCFKRGEKTVVVQEDNTGNNLLYLGVAAKFLAEGSMEITPTLPTLMIIVALFLMARKGHNRNSIFNDITPFIILFVTLIMAAAAFLIDGETVLIMKEAIKDSLRKAPALEEDTPSLPPMFMLKSEVDHMLVCMISFVPFTAQVAAVKLTEAVLRFYDTNKQKRDSTTGFPVATNLVLPIITILMMVWKRSIGALIGGAVLSIGLVVALGMSAVHSGVTNYMNNAPQAGDGTALADAWKTNCEMLTKVYMALIVVIKAMVFQDVTPTLDALVLAHAAARKMPAGFQQLLGKVSMLIPCAHLSIGQFGPGIALLAVATSLSWANLMGTEVWEYNRLNRMSFIREVKNKHDLWRDAIYSLGHHNYERFKWSEVQKDDITNSCSRGYGKMKMLHMLEKIDIKGRVIELGCGAGGNSQYLQSIDEVDTVHGITLGKENHHVPKNNTTLTRGWPKFTWERADIYEKELPYSDWVIMDIGEKHRNAAVEERSELMRLDWIKKQMARHPRTKWIFKVMCPWSINVLERMPFGYTLRRLPQSLNTTMEMYAIPGDGSRNQLRVNTLVNSLVSRMEGNWRDPYQGFKMTLCQVPEEYRRRQIVTNPKRRPKNDERLRYCRKFLTETETGPDYERWNTLATFRVGRNQSAGEQTNHIINSLIGALKNLVHYCHYGLTNVTSGGTHKLFTSYMNKSQKQCPKTLIEMKKIMEVMHRYARNQGFVMRPLTNEEIKTIIRNDAAIGSLDAIKNSQKVEELLEDPDFWREVEEEDLLHSNGGCRRCIFNTMGKREKKQLWGKDPSSRIICYWPLVSRVLEHRWLGCINMDGLVTRKVAPGGVSKIAPHTYPAMIANICKIDPLTDTMHRQSIADDVVKWDTRITKDMLSLEEGFLTGLASGAHAKKIAEIYRLYQNPILAIRRPHTADTDLLDIVQGVGQRMSGSVVTYAMNTLTNIAINNLRMCRARGLPVEKFSEHDYVLLGDNMMVSGDDCVVMLPPEDAELFARETTTHRDLGMERKGYLDQDESSVRNSNWKQIEFCSHFMAKVPVYSAGTFDKYVWMADKSLSEIFGKARLIVGQVKDDENMAGMATAYANYMLTMFPHRREVRLLCRYIKAVVPEDMVPMGKVMRSHFIDEPWLQPGDIVRIMNDMYSDQNLSLNRLEDMGFVRLADDQARGSPISPTKSGRKEWKKYVENILLTKLATQYNNGKINEEWLPKSCYTKIDWLN